MKRCSTRFGRRSSIRVLRCKCSDQHIAGDSCNFVLFLLSIFLMTGLCLMNGHVTLYFELHDLFGLASNINCKLQAVLKKMGEFASVSSEEGDSFVSLLLGNECRSFWLDQFTIIKIQLHLLQAWRIVETGPWSIPKDRPRKNRQKTSC